MAYPYRVVLTEAQRAELRGLVGSGSAPARMLTRARILLTADHGEGGPGWADSAIVAALGVNASTVLRVRRQFVTEGLDTTLARRRPDRVYERRLDGTQEAHLIAVACSVPPDGQARWTLRLLADELVRLEVVESISHETVRQTLKKTSAGAAAAGWAARPASSIKATARAVVVRHMDDQPPRLWLMWAHRTALCSASAVPADRVSPR